MKKLWGIFMATVFINSLILVHVWNPTKYCEHSLSAQCMHFIIMQPLFPHHLILSSRASNCRPRLGLQSCRLFRTKFFLFKCLRASWGKAEPRVTAATAAAGLQSCCEFRQTEAHFAVSTPSQSKHGPHAWLKWHKPQTIQAELEGIVDWLTLFFLRRA